MDSASWGMQRTAILGDEKVIPGIQKGSGPWDGPHDFPWMNVGFA